MVLLGLDMSKETFDNGITGDSTSLLFSIIESIPNMIFLKNAEDLRIEYINRAGEILLGVNRSELLGKSDYDLFPKEQADFFTDYDRKVLHQYDFVDIAEESIDTKFGTKYLHTKKITLRDGVGKPIYLLGISEDITERKIADEKLLFQAKIINQIHDSVVSTDMDSIITSWNKGAERLHGYKAEEVIGRHASMLFAKGNYDEPSREMHEKLMEKGDHETELRLARKNGEEFDGHLSLSLLYDNKNQPIGKIGFCLDITERKLLEAELDSYRDLLESLVEERTADLAAARDEAERANRAKSRFLSKMSHELRTPLNAILGFAQMLQLDGQKLEATQQENIDEILEAGHHLLMLINDVLDLSKIESGNLRLNIQSISVNEMMHQCIPLIKKDAKQNEITINDKISGNDYWVSADFTKLKQVLVNLLSNAIKYNKKGGVVTLDAKPKNDSRLVITIEDTGCGLSGGEIGDLFTPFNRLNTQSNIEGTGIGLVIAKEIVVAMGGQMGVESRVDVGSKFWIELDMLKSRRKLAENT